MNLFKTTRKTELHPERTLEMIYWSKKWGITIRQLNEAILNTGSLDIDVLKDHLKKNRVIHFTFLGWLRPFSGPMDSKGY